MPTETITTIRYCVTPAKLGELVDQLEAEQRRIRRRQDRDRRLAPAEIVRLSNQLDRLDCATVLAKSLSLHLARLGGAR